MGREGGRDKRGVIAPFKFSSDMEIKKNVRTEKKKGLAFRGGGCFE